MIDWNHVHYALMFTEELLGSLMVLFWPIYIRRHFKKNWSKYTNLLKWPKPEPFFKDVKYHFLRNYCEECDPVPVKLEGTPKCPNCDSILDKRTATFPVRVDPTGSGIYYETRDDGWYCGWCKSKWTDNYVRSVQTKFHRQNKVDRTVGTVLHQDGTVSGWTSYKFHPGGPVSSYAGQPFLADASQAQMLPTLFDKGLISGLAGAGVSHADDPLPPPDEGYGDS